MDTGRFVSPRRPSVRFSTFLALIAALGPACDEKTREQAAEDAAAASAEPSQSAPARPRAPEPKRVERTATAMATKLHFVAYTTETLDEVAVNGAIDAAIREVTRLEGILSEWRDDSEVGAVNRRAGEWVPVGPETFEVIAKALWAGRISEGTFDITFQSMSHLWKFGTAQDAVPRVPSPAAVARARSLVDYRKVELDEPGRRVRIPAGRAIGLGGIAKGYIVDAAARVLKRAGVRSFLAQAGGDLYGAGRKPDGTPWVSGVQDPRGPQGSFFATIELEDHAFSTAGDYARSFVLDGKRYHHIIDPRTGYPATASRSVTVWAKDALTADVIDDAVFILGPEKGLALAESIEDVGVLIVDARNQVWTSRRLKDKIRVTRSPTDGL